MGKTGKQKNKKFANQKNTGKGNMILKRSEWW
jgi:hypothetical protein